MMSNVSTLLIILVVIALGLALLNPSKWNTPLKSIISSYDPSTGQIDIGGLWSKILSANNAFLLGFALAGGIIASIFTGEATYGIFAGFTIFLLGFALLPFELFVEKDIPFFIKAVIGLPLVLMFIMAVIGWFRGNEL